MKRTCFLFVLLTCLLAALCVSAAEYTFDAKHPYDGVMQGTFHNIAITADKDTGYATYYLPKGMNPWAQATIVLTPNGVTAEDFSDSPEGKQWKAVADEQKIGLAFLAPVNGTWNVALDPNAPNDGAVINQLFFTMRSKSVKLTAPFSMDKTHCSLVGYQEGGAAALLFGAEYVTDFSSIVAVSATAVPETSIAAIAEKNVLPFPHNDALFADEMKVKANTVGMPVWFIKSETGPILDYFVHAAKAAPAEANEAAETAYEGENNAIRIWVSSKAQDAQNIFDLFTTKTHRFMGMQDGGRVAFSTDMNTPRFLFNEEEIQGETRRWITYVPSTYDGSKAVPLVMSIHGYTASMQSMVEESRWWEIAEKEGFIAVFPQGYVRDMPKIGNIPCAMWVSGVFHDLLPDVDPMVDVRFLEAILDKTEQAYNIDKTREYVTGHSNGSMMTLVLGAAHPERFAAIAPVAGFGVDIPASKTLLPTWLLYGEYETAMSKLTADSKTVVQLQALNALNGVKEAALAHSEQYDGQWQTGVFSNEDGVPLTQYTNILRTSHIYMPEEAHSIWYDFFVNYTRGEDGTLLYKGEPVTRHDYAADTGWYEPAEAKTDKK